MAIAPAVMGAATVEVVDTLIVGSGYAGAVAAYRLANAGRNVVVLERGQRWTVKPAGDTFATARNIDGRASWLGTGVPAPRYTGVLELFAGNGISVYTGAGVGGGSLVNNGITMQPTRNLFTTSFGNLLGYDEMQNCWYPRAQALLGATPIPDDVLNSPWYASARDFQREAVRAGLPIVKPGVLVDWNVVRQEIAGTAVRSTILGDSAFGINSGAKLSVDRTVLAGAEATGRVSVLTLHQVRGITRSGDSYVVTCDLLTEGGDVRGTAQFAARNVFLAAGSVHTTRLLVRAKARGDLPRLNQHVGGQWGNSGDWEYVRIGTQPYPPSTGGPANIGATDYANPYNPVTLLTFPASPSPVEGRGISAAIVTQICPPIGSFSYNAATDAAELNWPAGDPVAIRMANATNDVVGRLNTANPGTELYWSSYAHASHALGGVVLGRATRPDDGGVLGYNGLYVIDSALIPGSTGAVPPSLTVTALADRCVTNALGKGLAGG
ncbi:FAD-dependent oxidoreductase [Amycolatopsis sp.]|uniref:FAD-dependent oxidoreductase n=1 Tax=Amycolatopsis sp. TaxID=37632 RepID=UPI002D808833|nr:FAD-dependent oxidoreductase [Amycolatopsis sp.]